MNNEQLSGDRPQGGRRSPHRVRLPGFIQDDDIGLGDVIKRATSVIGIRPCNSCMERASRLNNWVIFSKNR